MLNLDKSTWTLHQFGSIVRNVNESVKDAGSARIDKVIALDHLDPGEITISRYGAVADGTTFTRRVRPGQTLFGKRRAYQRKAAYAEVDAICSGDILVFAANSEALSPRLLPFIVQSEAFHKHALGTSAGSLSPRTSWKALAVFQIALPSVDEQERLADLLWAVEALSISQAEAVEASQKAMKLWLDRRVDSAPMRPLPELTSEPIKNGLSIAETTMNANRTTVSISAVRDGRIASKGCLKDIQIDEARARPFVMRKGDFFVVRGNGNRDLVARGGLLESEGDLPSGTIYPDLLMRVRFDNRVMIPKFGAAVWNLDRVHQVLASQAKSTNGTWKINGKDLASHRLPCLALGEQAAVVGALDYWHRAIATKRSERLFCSTLKKALLQEIFGGES